MASLVIFGELVDPEKYLEMETKTSAFDRGESRTAKDMASMFDLSDTDLGLAEGKNMKITRRQLRRIIKEAIDDVPQIGDRYSLVRQTKRIGSYSPYREAEVVGFGRSPLGKTVTVKSISDPSASEFDIPLPAFKKQFRKQRRMRR